MNEFVGVIGGVGIKVCTFYISYLKFMYDCILGGGGVCDIVFNNEDVIFIIF